MLWALDCFGSGAQVKGLIAGENFRFGYRAKSTSEDLQRFAADNGLQCRIVQLEKSGDTVTSSTCIRYGSWSWSWSWSKAAAAAAALFSSLLSWLCNIALAYDPLLLLVSRQGLGDSGRCRRR